jgi:monoamine oxidase
MARTPLLRCLEHLSRSLSARKSGDARVPSSASPTRRDILKLAGLGAAGLAIGRRSLASTSPSPRIVIVGAGIAGLAAALTLEDAGFASEIYEASGRLGGRMHSDTTSWLNGQVSEHCGELIDTAHTTILGLAQRFSIQVDDLIAAQPPQSTETYFFKGKYYPAAQADLDFQPVYDALQQDINAAGYPTVYNSYTAAGFQLDHQSVYEWIQDRIWGGHESPMGQLLDVAYDIEYGADTRVQSALNLIYLLGYQFDRNNFLLFGESDEHYHLHGGNQRLPEEIARALKHSPIRTNTALEAIEQEPGAGYRLSFRSSETTFQVRADQVILALPFSVLRRLDYARAGFNALKRKTIEELGYGSNVKLHVQLNDRLWNEPGPWGVSTGTSYSDTGYQNTWDVTRAQAGPTGILVDYLGSIGVKFKPRESAHNAAARFLNELEPVFPGITAQWNGRATLDTPLYYPYTLGSYSYFKVGQYTTICGAPGERSGNCHFAGEHCSVNFQGYMEGGAEEGVRAANEIIADHS